MLHRQYKSMRLMNTPRSDPAVPQYSALRKYGGTQARQARTGLYGAQPSIMRRVNLHRGGGGGGGLLGARDVCSVLVGMGRLKL